MALTLCRLGAQVLLVRMWEWLILIPTATPLPQISHFLAICNTSSITMPVYSIRYEQVVQEKLFCAGGNMAEKTLGSVFL